MEVDKSAEIIKDLNLQEALDMLDKGLGEKLAQMVQNIKISTDNLSYLPQLYKVYSYLGDFYIGRHGKNQTAGACIDDMELDMSNAGILGPYKFNPTATGAKPLFFKFE